MVHMVVWRCRACDTRGCGANQTKAQPAASDSWNLNGAADPPLGPVACIFSNQSLICGNLQIYHNMFSHPYCCLLGQVGCLLGWIGREECQTISWDVTDLYFPTHLWLDAFYGHWEWMAWFCAEKNYMSYNLLIHSFFLNCWHSTFLPFV